MPVILAQYIEPLIPELVRSVGAAGALIGLLFILGVVVSGKDRDRWEQRYDEARQREIAKDQKLVDDIVPLMTRGIEAMAKLSEIQSRTSRDG